MKDATAHFQAGASMKGAVGKENEQGLTGLAQTLAF